MPVVGGGRSACRARLTAAWGPCGYAPAIPTSSSPPGRTAEPQLAHLARVTTHVRVYT